MTIRRPKECSVRDYPTLQSVYPVLYILGPGIPSRANPTELFLARTILSLLLYLAISQSQRYPLISLKVGMLQNSTVTTDLDENTSYIERLPRLSHLHL